MRTEYKIIEWEIYKEEFFSMDTRWIIYDIRSGKSFFGEFLGSRSYMLFYTFGSKCAKDYGHIFFINVKNCLFKNGWKNNRELPPPKGG